ncbi:hypothetical protein LPB86_16220 [Pedobacter sp. MC2016-14]|uniref:hypothetical protein n=1 Tax=Pedobacter sp. MC2016-14 TaxID=2897327 RepID=UPI001E456DFD|nr:hypothetical protein [Pedobacter sp. MC2016-14]MCD0489790.1 hypothetical protein [Pedobacter sp. MC2016-14]
MKSLSLKRPGLIAELKRVLAGADRLSAMWMLPGVALCFWLILRNWMLVENPNALVGEMDSWLYVLQGLIVFLVVVPLSWWLLQRFWTELKLPSVDSLTVNFNEMELWQKLGFYFASFAVLLLSAVGCLIAMC